MAATWNVMDIVKLAPEFAAVPVPIVQMFIDMADRRMSDLYYGSLKKDAGIFFSAHLLTLGQPQGTDAALSANAAQTGNVTAKSVGDVSVSFGGGAVSAMATGYLRSTLALTKYGLVLADMIKNRGPACQVL